MQILINENHEVIAFALIGGFESGIEVDNYSDDFIQNFEPYRYIFKENALKINESYKEIEQELPVTPLEFSSGNDAELRQTFGSLQMSSVQTVKMVMDLSKQVVALTKQNVELQKQINSRGVE